MTVRIRVTDTRALDMLLHSATGQAARRRMGEYLLSQAARAFQDQQRGGVAWPPRHVPNIAGILSDLKEAPRIKSRRFDARPAGVDTGQLGRFSLQANYVPTAAGFDVFSAVPYAGRFQEGGTSAIPLTGTMLANLAQVMGTARRATRRTRATLSGSLQEPRFFRAASKAARNIRTANLGWLFALARGRGKFAGSGGEYRVTVPPRPFLTVEPADIDVMTTIAIDAVQQEADR